jgi:hypothetical protein
VRRYLVVANQTLGGEELDTAIRDHMATGPCHFHLLVPATAAADLDRQYLAEVRDADPTIDAEDRRAARHLLEDELEVTGQAASGEDLGRRLARERLRQQLSKLRGLGAEASGEVGVADPVEAIRVVLHRWEFDAVILSTLPGRRSRWLAMDLPTRIRRTFKLPVTHVTGASVPTP